MPVSSFLNDTPVVDESTFIASTAWIIGKVEIKENVTIFFGATLRGDINHIKIGAGSNIQENALLHTSRGLGDCIIGENVTLGHGAILHGAEVKNNCIIGMGATILDNTVIEENCIIGANSLVSMDKVIPANSLVFGSPAKVIRTLSNDEIKDIKNSAIHYQKLGKEYKALNL